MNRFRLFAFAALLFFGLACQFIDEVSFLTASATETPTRAPTRRPTTAPTEPPPPPVAAVLTPTPAEITGTATENAIIRALPSTGAPVAARVNKGTQLTFTGRTPASDWFQVRLPSDPNGRGWISKTIVRADGSDQLPIVQPGGAPPPYPRP